MEVVDIACYRWHSARLEAQQSLSSVEYRLREAPLKAGPASHTVSEAWAHRLPSVIVNFTWLDSA